MLYVDSGVLKPTLSHLKNQENLKKQLILRASGFCLFSFRLNLLNRFSCLCPFAAHVFAMLTHALLGSASTFLVLISALNVYTFFCTFKIVK